MSISVIGAFSRMGLQPTRVITPSDNPFSPPVRTKRSPPQLPGEILYKIFKSLDECSPKSLYSVLQVNSHCYNLVLPILYETVHLNRKSLRGLFRERKDRGPYEGYWKNKWALTKATTLIIDDLFALIDIRSDEGLRYFCHSVHLPNVTKLIFRHDLRATSKYQFRRGEFEFFFTKKPEIPRSLNTWTPIEYKPPEPSRSINFSYVFGHKLDDICIHIPRNKNLRTLTTDRVLEYVSWLRGTKNIHIHQSVDSDKLTIYLDQRNPHIGRANTTYYFYRDLSTIPRRSRLFHAIEILLHQQIKPLIYHYMRKPNWANLFPQFLEILNGDGQPTDMIASMEEIMKEPTFWDPPPTEPRKRKHQSHKILENAFTELVAAIHSDCVSACPCCGDKGHSLDEDQAEPEPFHT